ncbi:MAG: ABC transporter permease [Rhodothermales bacterium]
MLLNTLRTSFRHLRRDAGYVLLNVGGLAIGLATCLVILMYVRTEQSVDRFHEKGDRIVRAWAVTTLGPEEASIASTAHPLADFVRERYTEVEASTRILPTLGTTLVSTPSHSAYETRIRAVEPSFFDMFDVQLAGADPVLALGAPYTVVLTPAMADRYFPDQDPVGQSVSIGFWGSPHTFTVTGLLKDVPGRSRFAHDALISYETYAELQSGGDRASLDASWNALNPETWFLLAPGADWRDLDRRMSPAVTEIAGGGEEVWFRYHLQPLHDVHLGGLGLSVDPEGDPDTLKMFSVIALVILLIACANYMNLATARGTRRAREVGVRKVFGARKSQLRVQFLLEAGIFTVLAVLGALLLLELSVSSINALAGRVVVDGTWYSMEMLAWLVGIATVTTFVAGAYPAFYLARFEPGTILRGSDRSSSGGGGGFIRRLLVVGQFAGGIALLMTTLGIREQMAYTAEKDLGFDRENVMFIPVRTGPERARANEIAVQMGQVPGVVQAAVASNVPNGITQAHGVRVVDHEDDEGAGRRVLAADAGYAHALGLEMAAGHWFRADRPVDAEGFILNESAARAMAAIMDGDASGGVLGLTLNRNGQEGPVIGVVKDFHFSALHSPIEPLVIYHPQGLFDHRTLVLRVEPGTEVLDRIRAAWEVQAPGVPFEYEFLDASVAALYESERLAGRLFGLFSGLGIVVACLGLFGLAAYTAHRRKKEIGIRKVLGAGLGSVMVLLSREFVVLVGLAVVVAAPVSVWLLDGWLDAFAYRVGLNAWVFVVPTLAALGIALVTVSGQALRAALANPVDSLRSE